MSAVTILLPGRDGSRQKHREVDMSDQFSCDKSRVAVLGLGHVASRGSGFCGDGLGGDWGRWST